MSVFPGPIKLIGFTFPFSSLGNLFFQRLSVIIIKEIETSYPDNPEFRVEALWQAEGEEGRHKDRDKDTEVEYAPVYRQQILDLNEEVIGWFCENFGFGEISLAYGISEQAGVDDGMNRQTLQSLQSLQTTDC